MPAFEASWNNALALDSSQADVAPAPHLEMTPETTFPAPKAVKLQQVTAKIIEFPRFAWAPPSPPPDQLAEPVGEQLRILEVPESQPAAPALGGIMIEQVQVEMPEKRLGIDVPLQIAPWRRRVAAAVVDGAIIASACALFGCIFWKIAAVRPPEIQLLGLAAGTLGAFWAVYEYLLIVYSGSTPGLHAAGLEASDLGLAPPRLTLLEPALAASSERDEADGADEIQGYSTRHARRMRGSPLRILQCCGVLRAG